MALDCWPFDNWSSTFIDLDISHEMLCWNYGLALAFWHDCDFRSWYGNYYHSEARQSLDLNYNFDCFMTSKSNTFSGCFLSVLRYTDLKQASTNNTEEITRAANAELLLSEDVLKEELGHYLKLQETWLAFAIITGILLFILLLIVAFLRARLFLAVALIKQGARLYPIKELLLISYVICDRQMKLINLLLNYLQGC